MSGSLGAQWGAQLDILAGKPGTSDLPIWENPLFSGGKSGAGYTCHRGLLCLSDEKKYAGGHTLSMY